MIHDEARAWFISRIDYTGDSNLPLVKSIVYLTMKKQNKKNALIHPRETRVSISIAPDDV